MIKIDVFSGFLGAGKTTLIKKLIKEAYSGEKLVLIENEFGEIGVDGGFMKEAGITVNELNSGCICCSLVGDFAEALKKVADDMKPDRILIEPSGVGKLSDVVRAVERAELADAKINSLTAVVDANKCKIYMKNFGEFFNDQIESAACIVFSHADVASSEKLATALKLVREHNPNATVVTTEWDKLDGKQILDAMEHASTLESELEKLTREEEEHGHCCHGHHHDDEDGHEHGRHCCHHDHDEDEEDEHGHCHHHDHDHDHGHEHGHHHHHADEVFTSWGVETSAKFTADGLKAALSELSDGTRFGTVLRAKGIVAGQNGNWLHFDYVPGEVNVREGSAEYTGRLCVIGSKLDEEELKELFGV
ncbi:MAG: GTP-binding protein [Clostridiales bacterium]|nr:GTP-binding protein [Clostridiales bacterium]